MQDIGNKSGNSKEIEASEKRLIIAYSQGMNCSTIGTIHMNKEKVMELVKNSVSMQCTITSVKN